MEVVKSEDEDYESIYKFKVMLHSFQFLQNKDSFISLLYVLYSSRYFEESKIKRSKQAVYDILAEISRKF